LDLHPFADPQRSPGSEMFAKQNGSPVGLRTYDPVVYNPQDKCFVFSRGMSLQTALK